MHTGDFRASSGFVCGILGEFEKKCLLLLSATMYESIFCPNVCSLVKKILTTFAEKLDISRRNKVRI